MGAGPGWRLIAAMAAGYAFLYLPIATLILFSFNDSRLVTSWTGFSTRWYGELFQNERLWAAAWTSLRLAAVAATAATIIGAAAGIALARLGGFRLRLLLAALVVAPMVMPEVVTGLSMLLAFVELERRIGWPDGRGLDTVAIAHVTFAIGFVAVVAQARLRGTDPELELAAADLGARPWTVLRTVTLPLLAPALVSGWLLAFTLSLDDLVIASFTSGPGATTLPILVFAQVRLGMSPQINALAALVVGVVAAGALLAGWLALRGRRDP